MKRNDAPQEFVKLEALGIERQASGLDLGEVENIIENFGKRSTGPQHDAELFLPDGIRLGPRHDLSHAEHTVERRADFVTHISQKSAFGRIGCLRLAGSFLGGG